MAASMTRCAWCASGQVAELFRAIDLDADGQIDYEDFMAAFAPDPRASEDGGTGRLADVEAAIQCVCEGADAVIVLLEATKEIDEWDEDADLKARLPNLIRIYSDFNHSLQLILEK